MNVFNNVGFGLKIKNIDKNIIKEKVLEVLSGSVPLSALAVQFEA